MIDLFISSSQAQPKKLQNPVQGTPLSPTHEAQPRGTGDRRRDPHEGNKQTACLPRRGIRLSEAESNTSNYRVPV